MSKFINKESSTDSSIIQDKILIEQQSNIKGIKESLYRFVVISLYCCLGFCIGMQWVTFIAVSTRFSEEYNIDSLAVDLFSIIFMLVYPIATFPSSYVIDNINLRYGLTFAATFTMIGAGLKALLYKGLVFTYLGQTLAAIAQPFILNSPGKIAAVWFRDEKV